MHICILGAPGLGLPAEASSAILVESAAAWSGAGASWVGGGLWTTLDDVSLECQSRGPSMMAGGLESATPLSLRSSAGLGQA